MKKAISIFLVALLLLNVLGYYGIFLGWKYRNSLHITQRLDAEDYKASETITIKVPLTIPYYGDTDFQRVNGEIEHKGEFYRLVKQKLEKDTLYIVCIKDLRSKRIKQALAEYVKTFSDQSGDHSNVNTLPAFIKDYVSTSFSLGSSSSGWSQVLSFHQVKDSLSTHFFADTSPPPEA